MRIFWLQGVLVALGFLFTIVATRMMGMEAYGQIAYAIAIGNILSAAMRYGTDETLIVSMTRADNKVKLLASLHSWGAIGFITN